jgi:hypothetical protein
MSQEERRNEPFIGEATILECQYFQKNETLAYLGISNLFKNSKLRDSIQRYCGNRLEPHLLKA